MAEPSLSAALGVTAASGAVAGAAVVGMDLNAVVGAFAGSMFFVVFARELATWDRLGYFLVSWIAGYYLSAELLGYGFARTSGWAAFVGALFVVTLGVTALEWLRGGQMPQWVRFLLDRLGGRNG